MALAHSVLKSVPFPVPLPFSPYQPLYFQLLNVSTFLFTSGKSYPHPTPPQVKSDAVLWSLPMTQIVLLPYPAQGTILPLKSTPDTFSSDSHDAGWLLCQ